MNKINKILALVLTVALMLSAVVAVFASAEDSASFKYDDKGYVIAANVAYDDNLAPMFAVDRSKLENVKFDPTLLGDTPLLVVEVVIGTDTVKAEYQGRSENFAFGGSTYDAGIYKVGIAPKILDSDLTVKLYTVKGEGETEEKVDLGSFTYNVKADFFDVKIAAEEALGENGNAAKLALYKATVAYAAAAKEHFGN